MLPDNSSGGVLFRANAELNFRNGGSAEGSLSRRGGRPISKRGWGTLPTKAWPADGTHPETLEGDGAPSLPVCAPALSQALLSESLGKRPERNGLAVVSSAQGQGLW